MEITRDSFYIWNAINGCWMFGVGFMCRDILSGDFVPKKPVYKIMYVDANGVRFTIKPKPNHIPKQWL